VVYPSPNSALAPVKYKCTSKDVT